MNWIILESLLCYFFVKSVVYPLINNKLQTLFQRFAEFVAIKINRDNLQLASFINVVMNPFIIIMGFFVCDNMVEIILFIPWSLFSLIFGFSIIRRSRNLWKDNDGTLSENRLVSERNSFIKKMTMAWIIYYVINFYPSITWLSLIAAYANFILLVVAYLAGCLPPKKGKAKIFEKILSAIKSFSLMPVPQRQLIPIPIKND